MVPREWTRTQAEHAIADALAKALLVEVNGGELEHIATVYKPEGQAIVLCAAVLDALDLPDVFTVIPGRLEQTGWCRTGWFHRDATHSQCRPGLCEPVYRVVPT